jgi:hypothetical protein
LLGLVRLPGLTGASDCPDFIVLPVMTGRVDDIAREAPQQRRLVCFSQPLC